MNLRTAACIASMSVLCAVGSAAAETTDPVLHTALMGLQGHPADRSAPLVVSVPLGGEFQLRLDGPKDAIAAVAESDELGLHSLKLRRERTDGHTRFERVVLMPAQQSPGLYRVHIRITAGNGSVSYRTILVDAYEEIGC